MYLIPHVIWNVACKIAWTIYSRDMFCLSWLDVNENKTGRCYLALTAIFNFLLQVFACRNSRSIRGGQRSTLLGFSIKYLHTKFICGQEFWAEAIFWRKPMFWPSTAMLQNVVGIKPIFMQFLFTLNFQLGWDLSSWLKWRTVANISIKIMFYNILLSRILMLLHVLRGKIHQCGESLQEENFDKTITNTL